MASCRTRRRQRMRVGGATRSRTLFVGSSQKVGAWKRTIKPCENSEGQKASAGCDLWQTYRVVQALFGIKTSETSASLRSASSTPSFAGNVKSWGKGTSRSAKPEQPIQSTRRTSRTYSSSPSLRCGCFYPARASSAGLVTEAHKEHDTLAVFAIDWKIWVSRFWSWWHKKRERQKGRKIRCFPVI